MKAKTLKSILKSLPNGFEDCFVHAVSLEIAARSAFLKIAVIVERNPDGTSCLRMGRLSATGVHTFFVEPPDPLYPFLLDGEGAAASEDVELNGMGGRIEQVIGRLPSNVEVIRFFFHDWNSFLYLAADAFTFVWNDRDAL